MKKGGFTLVEFLVVIAVIATLAGMFLPSLTQAREKARVANCINNLKQMGLVLMMYANDHDGLIMGGDTSGKYWWMDGIDLYSGGKGYANNKIFYCPSDPNWRANGGSLWNQSYGENRAGAYDLSGSYGPFVYYRLDRFTAPDRTLYITERSTVNTHGGAAATYPYVSPTLDVSDDIRGPLSQRHNNMCNTLFLDGHVASVSNVWLLNTGSMNVEPWYGFLGPDGVTNNGSWLSAGIK